MSECKGLYFGKEKEILFSLILIKGALSQEVHCFKFIINLLKKEAFYLR